MAARGRRWPLSDTALVMVMHWKGRQPSDIAKRVRIPAKAVRDKIRREGARLAKMAPEARNSAYATVSWWPCRPI